MSFTPRDYQLECVSAIRTAFRRGDQTALVKLPTGSGKTRTVVTFINQILEVKADYRVMILVPKVKILREFLQVLSPLLTTVASDSYGKVDTSGQIVVGTFQTLINRSLPEVDLIVCDECHLLNDLDPDSQYYTVVRTLLDKNPEAKVIGLTATPFRDTGLIYGSDRFFQEPVFERDLLWTTEMGFTVKARVYQPPETFDLSTLKVDNTGEYSQTTISALVANKDKAILQVDDIIKKTKDRKKIAIACANIKHSEMITELLEERNERAIVVHSKQEDDECDESLEEFENNSSIRFMTFVTMVSIGYNYPPIDCIVLLRPTRRAQLYIQTAGRGLRPSPETGKKDCLVLDYGRVVENCGPLNAPYVSRGGKRGLAKAMDDSPQATIICHECGAFNFPLKTDRQASCTECGVQLVIKKVVDPTKNLEEEAAIVDLYARTKKAKVVKAVIYKPLGFTQTEMRRKKKITVIFVDNSTATFFVTNPMFAVVDNKARYDQVAWLEGIERKHGQLIKDITGEHHDMRSIEYFYKRATQAVEVTYENKKGFDNYKSHRVIPNFSIDESESGAGREVIDEHIAEIKSSLGGRIVSKKPLNKQDKLFLKRGF